MMYGRTGTHVCSIPEVVTDEAAFIKLQQKPVTGDHHWTNRCHLPASRAGRLEATGDGYEHGDR
jgi:hypothetical protein